VAQIVENRTSVQDYDGPLSNLGEYHAAEFGFKYGLVSGLTRQAPEVATGVGMLAGVSSVRKVADTGLPTFAKRNALYVIVFFIAGLLVGIALGPTLSM